MNPKIIAYVLGRVVLVLGLTFLPSLAWAGWYKEAAAATGLMESMLMCGLVGGALYFFGRGAPRAINQREALFLVTLGWTVSGIIAAVPFVATAVLSPVEALFESFSGLTTCGASVIDNLDEHPRSILFWRSFTHWLGGMGIIVLFLAVLPSLGVGGKMLLAFETTQATSRSRIKVRLSESVLMVAKIYCTLTVLQTIALMATGTMGLFDALCHTFGTLATGGFSTQQASVGAYDSLAVELVVIFFMVCGATSFALHNELWHGQVRNFFRDSEWRVFIAILGGGIVLCTLNVLGWFGSTEHVEGTALHYNSAGKAFRSAAFTVTSIMTNTGFVTEDFDQWPYLSRMLLVLLMFAGGCAGSTCGGIKILRVYVLMKLLYLRIEHLFRPHLVRAVRVNDQVIDKSGQAEATTFFLAFLVTLGIGCLAMSAWGLPFDSAVSSVAACMTCTGPGLGLIGASETYSTLSDGALLTLVVLMVLGRLEILTALALVLPGFWRVGR